MFWSLSLSTETLVAAARVLSRQRAEAEGLSVDLRVGSAEALPWPDAIFDLVYSYGVIHHAARPEAVVAEACRVLKPGGAFKAMLYNRRSLNLQFPVVFTGTPSTSLPLDGGGLGWG